MDSLSSAAGASGLEDWRAAEEAQALRPLRVGFPDTKMIQERLGRAIRRRRRLAEITLLELARACDVSFQQIQKYEAGVCSISAAQLWNIARALGVPVTYFYEGLTAANQ